MECTSLGQLTSQAPGTETRNRNQEELETTENKGTRSAVAKKIDDTGITAPVQAKLSLNIAEGLTTKM